jgi:acetoin:2,6-dichlorophenolindophenol oxidoreductase subunit beta
VSWFHNVPGLKVVTPSGPADAKALLKAAIRDDNPVLFFEHKRLYTMKEEVPEGDDVVATIGEARVLREGSDITLVSAMRGVHDCLAAAELLSAAGVSAEVIDLRTIRPLDRATVVSSLARTNRLAVVEEGPRTGGWAGEVLAVAVEEALGDVDDVWRIATADHPIPYSPPLEDAFYPDARAIAESVTRRLGGSAIPAAA